jgi:antitoxin component HigA of HigAB toxin-antitoxin module
MITKVETKHQYNEAMERIDYLLDLPIMDKHDYVELNILSAKVVAYEDIHYTIDVPSVEDQVAFRKDQESTK